MEYKDYYKILDIGREASLDEVKRAYRRLARKYHPDVSKEPNAEARFKEVNEAYEVLKDPQKRAAYDHLGTQWQAGQEFRPPPDFDFGFSRGESMSPDDLSHFSDFFASIFGGRGFGTGSQAGFQSRSRRGQNQTVKIHLSLEEAYHGGTRTLHLDSPETDLQGRTTSRHRTLRVQIPSGVTQGQQIRLAAQGLPGSRGGPAGDLFLEVQLQPHPFYRPEGKDVYLNLPIAPWEAALGAQVPVPTLAGPVTLRIPPGSQAGNKLRLKGRGLPGEPPGDEYVVLEILVPEARTQEIERAFRQLESVAGFNPRARLGV